MCNRTVKALFLGTALLLASALPAAAQTLGAGVSFLSDEGGTGITVDYSKPFRTLEKDKTLGWVGELTFAHNGFEGGSVNTLMIQGGARITGKIDEKISWHGQGLIGIARGSSSSDVCAAVVGVDCDASDTNLVFSPGAGIDYTFKPNMAARGQIDFPIVFGGSTNSAVRLWLALVWTLAN